MSIQDAFNTLKKMPVIIVLIVAPLFSQPSLDPEQTVNTATGEMSFALPLATVKGVNGHDFPITLNYQAGIKLQQEASCAGLGFSFGAGGISRKVVYVPDDNSGGFTNYFWANTQVVDKPWWYWPVEIFLVIVAIVCTVFSAVTFGQSNWGASIALSALGALASTGQVAATRIAFGSGNFISGGSHIRNYTPKYNFEDFRHGRGCFKGGVDDLPDIYFVSTPFISGQLVWIGDKNQKGHFVLKQTGGSAVANKTTTKIDYDVENEIFTIQMADGTKLFFEKTLTMKAYNKVFGQCESGATDITSEHTEAQQEPSPVQWVLTKVLFEGCTDTESRGAWMKFHYSYNSANARPLTENMQVSKNASMTSISLTTGDEEEGAFSEILLDSIVTPNQKAQFHYADGRKDVAYFKFADMDWHVNSRSVPAAQQINSKIGTPDPVNRKVLDHITLLNAMNVPLQNIEFITDYYLRPNSLHSFSKNTNGEFVPISGNPSAACLTLKEITVYDLLSNAKSPVTFKYSDNNPYAWDSSWVGLGSGPNPQMYYCEKKDVWGFYCPYYYNKRNDFNSDGNKYRAAAADAWSLSSVTLPSGNSITWEYEPNRYIYANGLPVKKEADETPIAKFGGGIRVKKMIVDNGLGKKMTRSYFYTNQKGVFVENLTAAKNVTNSSGYTPVEPYNYIDNTDTCRDDGMKGGLYTPSKVSYSMTQVVDGYIQPSAENPNGIAPNGYTVYCYSHNGDPLAADFHPNSGKYGEIDSSWKRGYLTSMEVYGSTGVLNAQTKYTYEYIAENPDNLPLSNNVFDEFLDILQENTYGWVKLVSAEQKVNGLTSTTHYKYAPDIATASPDNIPVSPKEIKIFNAGKGIESLNYMHDYDRAVVCRTKKWGDPAIDDVFLIYSFGSDIINICFGRDIGKGNPNTWTQWTTCGTDAEMYVIGATLWNVDAGDSSDLIVVSATRQSSDWILNVNIFYDIGVNDDNQVVYKNNDAYLTMVKIPEGLFSAGTGGSAKYSFNTDWPCGCLIDNFYGDSAPDFVLLTNANYYNIWRYPGDRFPESSPYPTGRFIFAITDFAIASYDGGEVEPAFWGSVSRYNYFGHAGFRRGNDLIIVGPGGFDEDHSTSDQNKPFAYQIFSNMSFNSSNNTIDFTAACANCNDESYKIFNGMPGGGWDSTKFAGVFDDVAEDRQKFIFYSKGPNLCVVDYAPFTYTGDYDGQPNEIWEMNSGGGKRITAPIPAYWKYPEMGLPSMADNKHMLIQQCQKIVYEKSDNSTVLLPQDARFAQTTTWSNRSFGLWRPCSTFAWTTPMNANGAATIQLPEFNFVDPSLQDASWKFKSGLIRTNSLGNPVEAIKPISASKVVHSNTVYGTPANLPIGTISNADYRESGVFTCDYNLNETGTPYNYFDKNNGWEIGVLQTSPYPPTGTISDVSPHFGQKSLHMANGEGLMRCFKIRGGTEYRLSFWANVTSGTMPVNVEYRKETAPISDWPVQYNHPSLATPYNVLNDPQGATGGSWRLVKVSIPAVSGDDNWIRVTIGAHGATFDAFVDDVRFAPKNAKINTTYYDHLCQKIRVSVDANNNPSDLMEYDGFGRDKKQWKINKTDPSSRVLKMEKKYVMMGENVSILSPAGGEIFYKNLQLDIRWNYKKSGATVNIILITPDGETALASGYDGSIGQFIWPIPAGFGSTPVINDCFIKIEDAADPVFKVDYSKSFTIGSNTVFSPAAASVWPAMSNLRIEWILGGAANATIMFYRNATDPSPIPVTTVANSGRMTHVWKLPNTVNPTDQSFIRIVDAGNNANYVDSGVFIINKPVSFIKRFILDLMK